MPTNTENVCLLEYTGSHPRTSKRRDRPIAEVVGLKGARRIPSYRSVGFRGVPWPLTFNWAADRDRPRLHALEKRPGSWSATV